jgi:hypothetical protein
MKIIGKLCLLALITQPFGLIYAFETELDAGLGVAYVDNSRKTSDNEESDYETFVDGALGLGHEGESWLLELDYRARYTEYDQNTQDDSTKLDGDTKIRYEQIDKALFWNFTNSIQNIKSDKQSQDIGENRENRSITRFYPELFMNLSKLDDLKATVSYTRVDYQDTSGQDSERVGGEATWAHKLSTTDAFGLQVVYDNVTFDNSLSDYEYLSARVGYQAVLARLNYDLAVGYNDVRRDEFEDADGLYIKADFIYDNDISQWQLSLLRDLTDTSIENANDRTTDLGDAGNAGDAVDIYETRSVQLEFTTVAVCERCNLKFSVYYEDEDYQILPDDNQELGAVVGFGYRLSRLSSINLNARFQDFSFDNNVAGEDYTVQRYNVNYDRTIFRDFTLGAFFSFEKRDSDRKVATYDAYRVGLALSYSFL